MCHVCTNARFIEEQPMTFWSSSRCGCTNLRFTKRLKPPTPRRRARYRVAIPRARERITSKCFTCRRLRACITRSHRVKLLTYVTWPSSDAYLDHRENVSAANHMSHQSCSSHRSRPTCHGASPWRGGRSPRGGDAPYNVRLDGFFFTSMLTAERFSVIPQSTIGGGWAFLR